jgi:putative nucleotidyltransferase with HDIG domain
MIDPRIQGAVIAAEGIEALPSVVSRAMEAIYSSRSGAKEVADIIGLDPALSGRILRLVNSPFYRTMSRPVVSLAEAVLRLGYQSVQSALLTSATTSLLCPPLLRYGLERKEFWNHSVAVALSARSIARLVRLGGAEEAYIAGLLHDIGKVGMDRQQASAMAAVRLIVRDKNVTYHEAEQERLGFDHAFVGQLVATKWGLPDSTISAIGGHHQAEPELDMLSAAIVIADTMAWLMGFPGAKDEASSRQIDPSILGQLNLSMAMIENLIKETTPAVNESLGLLSSDSPSIRQPALRR